MTTTIETTGTLTDRHGRAWVWDPGLHSLRHDDGTRTLLRDRDDLEAEAGPLTVTTPEGVPAEGEDVAEVAESAGWFEPITPPGGTRCPDELEDTQPWMPAVGATPTCAVCTDQGAGPCHCRITGWVAPEDVPAAVHGREQMPGGAT